MSRTDAHVPADVEEARKTDHTVFVVQHRHWAAGRGIVSCPDPDARCEARLPRWASRQPWTRRGSAVVHRRSAVRDALRVAVQRHRAGDDLFGLLMPDPEIYCLCQLCGVEGP